MREERGQLEGDLCVSDALAVHGAVTGSITVRRGGSLHLHGACGGNLAVEAGASASVLGMVGGQVFNHGGQLSVHGMVTGAMTCHLGETVVGHASRVLGGISGTVIQTCQGCSQRLSVPGQHRELQVTCPKCRATWSWAPAGMGGAGSQHQSVVFRGKEGKAQEIVASVFRNIDMNGLMAAAQQAGQQGEATTPAEPPMAAMIKPTAPDRPKRRRPWWRFW